MIEKNKFSGEFLASFLVNMMVCFVNRQKLHLKLRFYDLDHVTTTCNNNKNNRLPSKLSGWLANPSGTRFPKLIEEISQEQLNACLYVSTVYTHLRGLQLPKKVHL